MRPQIEAIHQKLIDFWKFKPAASWDRARFTDLPEIITSDRHLYLIDDQDAKIYYAELDEEIKKAGYNVKPGYCPLLMAESNVREAERLLIDAAFYITGITHEQVTYSMKDYRKMIELILKLSAPFVDSKKIMQEL